MIRLLILFAIGYLSYRLAKSWISKNIPPPPPVGKRTSGEIDDVMVKDPVCEVYFPKRDGIRVKIDGKELYFCSKACRDKYLASRSKPND